MKILVAYDGTLQSKEALVYGMKKVREQGGEVIAMHVFDRGLFVDYDATPDALQFAREDSARYVEEAKVLITGEGAGVRASLVTTEGDPEEAVLSYAKEQDIDVLLCPPRYRSMIKSGRKAIMQDDEPFFQYRYRSCSLS